MPVGRFDMERQLMTGSEYDFGSHGYDYAGPVRPVEVRRQEFHAARLAKPDDPISWSRASAFGLIALLGVAVFLATVTFAAFEAGRRAEREAIKAAAEGYLP